MVVDSVSYASTLFPYNTTALVLDAQRNRSLSIQGVAPMMSPHMLYWQHPAGINLNPTYPASTPNSYASLPSGIRLPG